MKFVALVSGGKDSIYALIESIRHGHELMGCVHLGAPSAVVASSEGDEEESYMYQTAASEVLATVVDECLGVPLIYHRRVGKSVNTSLVYQQAVVTITSPEQQCDLKDEVEDLYDALKMAQEHFPGLEAVASGAILSTYQRVRIEHVCSRLGLTSLSYLWRRAPQDQILRDMIHQQHIDAVLVKTACPPGLMPRQHLNKSIKELEPYFHQLHAKYRFHICGEGGEYETLVLDCPIYQRKLVLDEVEVVETEDGVGLLSIRQWHTEPKESTPGEKQGLTFQTPAATTSDSGRTAISTDDGRGHVISAPVVSYLPHVQRLPGGLLHLSEILSPVAAAVSNESEADGAVEEALAIFQLLERALQRHGASPQDVMLVHLYLSEISHFALINTHYRAFFGTFLPPSRSCVAVGKRVLPGGRRVLLDCIVQCGSGDYLRTSPPPPPSSNASDANDLVPMGYAKAALLNTSSKLREVLHVQSISNWASTCVGPYSQANTLRSGLVFLAGQIGLIPTNMKLRETWRTQLTQCWTNVANVMDALQAGSLDHILSCLVYVSTKVLDEEKNGCWDAVETISYQHIATNAGVVPGAIESTAKKALLFGGYEDEQTMLELKGVETDEKPVCPLLLVSIPEMPMGALVEVEVIAASQRAASCLTFSHFSRAIQNSNCTDNDGRKMAQWNTGFDFGSPSLGGNKNICIEITSRILGVGCAASVLIAASAQVDLDFDNISADVVLGDMMHALEIFLNDAGSGLSVSHALHIRLYYVGASLGEVEILNDGTRLRSSLAFQVASRWPMSTPATSVVPVRAMRLSQMKNVHSLTFLAMNVIMANPVHLETEMWIRHGRDTV